MILKAGKTCCRTVLLLVGFSSSLSLRIHFGHFFCSTLPPLPSPAVLDSRHSNMQIPSITSGSLLGFLHTRYHVATEHKSLRKARTNSSVRNRSIMYFKSFDHNHTLSRHSLPESEHAREPNVPHCTYRSVSSNGEFRATSASEDTMLC
jgi:hypothetical protein